MESGGSIVDAIVRERKEETGLTILAPRLCGVKQFPIEGGRYPVFLFTAQKWEGELVSSQEGAMHWVKKNELSAVNLAHGFETLLQVMLDDRLNELQYLVDGDVCKTVLK